MDLRATFGPAASLSQTDNGGIHLKARQEPGHRPRTGLRFVSAYLASDAR